MICLLKLYIDDSLIYKVQCHFHFLNFAYLYNH